MLKCILLLFGVTWELNELNEVFGLNDCQIWGDFLGRYCEEGAQVGFQYVYGAYVHLGMCWCVGCGHIYVHVPCSMFSETNWTWIETEMNWTTNWTWIAPKMNWTWTKPEMILFQETKMVLGVETCMYVHELMYVGL